MDAFATEPLVLGQYRARLADGLNDLIACRSLRRRFFETDRSGGDAFDDVHRHVVLEDVRNGALRGTFRVLFLPRPVLIERAYASQYYDLVRLEGYPGGVMELGRFCLDPEMRDADLLRLAWAFITRLVDTQNVALLFGCASFPDADPARHAEAFAYLRARYLGPARWRPGVRSDLHVPLETGARPSPAGLPPLLKSYLGLGGWVSDHAVIDREMRTIHVFTAVEIARIPPERARVLRAIASGVPAA